MGLPRFTHNDIGVFKRGVLHGVPAKWVPTKIEDFSGCLKGVGYLIKNLKSYLGAALAPFLGKDYNHVKSSVIRLLWRG